MGDVKHTTHPWKAVKGRDDDLERWQIVQDLPGGKEWHIAVIENGAPGDFVETEGVNACLIASAPELLEALEGMLENYIELKRISLLLANSDGPWGGSHMTPEDDVFVIQARAAITKSKGTKS